MPIKVKFTNIWHPSKILPEMQRGGNVQPITRSHEITFLDDGFIVIMIVTVRVW